MLFKGFMFFNETLKHLQVKYDDFHSQTYSVVHLFEDHLPKKLCFNDIYAIQFECSLNLQLQCKGIELDGILRVQIPYDVNEFFTLSDSEKKKVTLELLMKGMKCVADEKGYDLEPFINAYNGVIADNYEYKKTFKKPKLSPNRKLKARIEVVLGLYEFSAYLIVEDKMQNEVVRRLISTTIQRWELLYSYLGELKWIDNEIIRLYQRKPQEQKYIELKLK